MSVSELPRERPGAEFERTPPQDIVAEQSVLGGMLLSKDAIADVVEVIRGSDFYRPAHETVYDAVLDLYGRGEPADAVTVSAELTKRGEIGRIGGAPYLHTLMSSVPTAANAGYYARIVREQAILRRLVEAGTRITQLGYAGDGEVDEVVDRAQAEIYQVTERRTSEDYQPLSSIMQGTLDEIEAIDSHDGTLVGVPTGFADLDSVTNGLHPGQMVIVAGRPAMGKALALDTPLPTPTGWTTMGDVAVGDELLGADGCPTRVVAVTEVLHGRPCYEISFSDHTRVVADAEHQWITTTRSERRAAQEGSLRGSRQPPEGQVRTTAEIAATLRCETADRRRNHDVATARPLDLPPQDLLVPPYVLGAWLGDGHTDAARITTADPEMIMLLEAEGLVVRPSGKLLFQMMLPKPEVLPRSCKVCGRPFLPRVSSVRTCGRSCGGWSRSKEPRPAARCPDCGSRSAGTARCMACHQRLGTLQARLRTIGVLGLKHIPTAYLRGSVEQRRALLAGLLDTDGTVVPTGEVQFTVTNQRLARDAYELVISLGYRCMFRRRRVRGRSEASSTAYTIGFSTDDEVFRLTRKRLVHKERGTRQFTRRGSRFITDVVPVPSVPVRCLQVDNEDHLYLATRSMIPTHNSTFALDVARSASIKHGLASVIFSLEMSRNEITMRLLSAEAKVLLHKMRAGGLADDDWTKLARRMGEVSGAPLFIDDSPNMSMMEIRAKCRRLKQRHDLRLVIVDYLQLMTSGKRVESRQVEVSEFSRSMKLLAKELDLPVIAVSQLNRGAEQRTDKRPMLSDLRESGCLTAETRLLRADTGAEISFGELMKTDERDIPVWSLDDRLKLVPRTMTHAFPSGVKPVFRVTLASGRTVTATSNHPFLTYDGWRPLGELAEGSRVGVARHVPPPLVTTIWPEAEVVMLAHLIGDGSFVRRQPIRYASIDERNLVAVTEAAKHFGITAVRDEHAAARVTSLRLPAPFHLTHGKRNPIAAWLDDLGLFGLRSPEKFIPEGVFGLPKEQVGLFIKHLWATDGSVRWDSKVRQARIYYATTSRRLADDLARLLLRFNVFCRIKTARKEGYRDCYHVLIYGADNQLRFIDEIGVNGDRGDLAQAVAEELRPLRSNTNLDTVPVEVWDDVRSILKDKHISHRAFSAAIGTKFCGSTLWKHAPSRTRLAKIAQVLDVADLEVMATNDVYWDTVTEIESQGDQEVYDATVLGNHNFIADGIALHNSLEQDADMVILLHREDMYEKESPRAGEADLILAKHRNGPTHSGITVAFQGHYSRFVDMAHG